MSSLPPPVIAVAGQTPPPHHGQAAMIAALLAGDYAPIRLVHVPMRFSEAIADVGRFRPSKLVELGRVIGGLWRARFRDGARVLYYPPAGPHRVPILRDLAILLATRALFDATIFHFHAGGLSEAYPRLPPPIRPLFRRAYGRPDLTIRPSSLAPEDGRFLRTRRDVVVPYGIEDEARRLPRQAGAEARTGPIRLLFVAALRESKGVGVLLEAAGRLVARGHDLHVTLVGDFVSAPYEAEVRRLIETCGLDGRVDTPGVLTGEAKHRAFARADVFCFPTFYESETFGLVLVEAMSHGLPIVATRWRGVPAVVDEQCARLAAPRDAGAFADALAPLLSDPSLRARMGRAGRARFEREFTTARYHARLRDAFALLTASPSARPTRIPFGAEAAPLPALHREPA